MLYKQSLRPDPSWYIPNCEACYKLWDVYQMLDNIKSHSYLVAKTALYMYRSLLASTKTAFKAGDNGLTEESLTATALLHDIAKSYTILHGGDHAKLGAAFVREKTGNPFLAHGVYAHISWHFDDIVPLSEKTYKIGPKAGTIAFASQKKYDFFENPLTLPLLISYADKRVSHSEIVTLEERCKNLFERYGHTEQNRRSIQANFDTAKKIEQAFAKEGMDVEATKEAILKTELQHY